MEKHDSVLYTVQLYSTDPSTPSEGEWPLEIRELIAQYRDIFQEP